MCQSIGIQNCIQKLGHFIGKKLILLVCFSAICVGLPRLVPFRNDTVWLLKGFQVLISQFCALLFYFPQLTEIDDGFVDRFAICSPKVRLLQATNHFQFFTAAQLNINIPICSIFIKCGMYQVFAQRLTYMCTCICISCVVMINGSNGHLHTQRLNR